MKKRVVTFPIMGNYAVAEKTAGKLFGDEVLRRFCRNSAMNMNW
jgi:hypothetical protein